MSERNTKRIAIEGVVIVLSILLAFAIDALWDERRERIEEAEMLHDLQQEFVGNQTALQLRMDYHSEMLATIQELLKACRQQAWSSSTLSIDEAFTYLLSPPTSDLGNGALDALITAGRINVLSNTALRGRLDNWRRVMGEVQDDEILGRTVVFERVVPYMMRWGVPRKSIRY